MANKKKYTIETFDTNRGFPVEYASDDIGTCFSDYIYHVATWITTTDDYQNVLYALQDLSESCSDSKIQEQIDEVCDVIELLLPKAEQENVGKDRLTILYIIRKYILWLVKHLSDDLIIDLCDELVALGSIDFKMKKENKTRNSKTTNKKEYTIKIICNDYHAYEKLGTCVSSTNHDIKKCFLEFLNATATHICAPKFLKALMFGLDKLNISDNEDIARKMDKVTDVIEVFNPQMEQESVIYNKLVLYKTMRDYITDLVNAMPDNLVIDLCDELALMRVIEVKGIRKHNDDVVVCTDTIK